MKVNININALNKMIDQLEVSLKANGKLPTDIIKTEIEGKKFEFTLNDLYHARETSKNQTIELPNRL